MPRTALLIYINHEYTLQFSVKPVDPVRILRFAIFDSEEPLATIVIRVPAIWRRLTLLA